ncbi:hypothetical protein DKX38_014897 [Salix brachista]|uniref:Uncharacterized protein n=1 Tax=Salix brachista TaxID=2182728 RepID=A0A5N5L3N9_9ROSI|nr:hypothetical protein DKX38_014897 [Salix brachista]
MAERDRLARIGLEGFADIDEHFGRAKRRPPAPKVIDCNEAAQLFKGKVFIDFRNKVADQRNKGKHRIERYISNLLLKSFEALQANDYVYTQNFLHSSLAKLIVDEELRKNMIPNPCCVSKCVSQKGKCFAYTPFLDLSQPSIINGTRQKRDVLQLPPYFIFAKKDKQEYILLVLKQNDRRDRLSVIF